MGNIKSMRISRIIFKQGLHKIFCVTGALAALPAPRPFGTTTLDLSLVMLALKIFPIIVNTRVGLLFSRKRGTLRNSPRWSGVQTSSVLLLLKGY